MKKQYLNHSKTLTSYPWPLEHFGVRLIDLLFQMWPRPIPPENTLRQCKIVSHRGVYDNQTVMENTLEAFEGVKYFGIWGVEFDVRWTKDLVPVVIHDTTLERLFGSPIQVSRETLSTVKERFPMIPTLEEVVNKFGKDLHLMVEIKKERFPIVEYQNIVLKDIFKNLLPKEDYHLLSLDPEMFDLIHFVSRDVCLPIATKNVGMFSRMALARGYGGVNGHYLLVDNAVIAKHHREHQKVGTGFVESINCLCRELDRGVDWIYSNDAVNLQTQLNALLSVSSP